MLVMYMYTLHYLLLLFLVPLSDCEELHFSAGEFAIVLIMLIMMGVVCRVTVEGVVGD